MFFVEVRLAPARDRDVPRVRLDVPGRRDELLDARVAMMARLLADAAVRRAADGVSAGGTGEKHPFPPQAAVVSRPRTRTARKPGAASEV